MQNVLQVINKSIKQFISSSGEICGVHALQFSIWPDIWSFKGEPNCPDYEQHFVLQETLCWELQCLLHFSAVDSICINEPRNWDWSSRKKHKGISDTSNSKEFSNPGSWGALADLGFSLCLLPQVTAEQLLKRGTAVWKTRRKKEKKNYPILNTGMGIKVDVEVV